MNISLTGNLGSGKSTLCKKICEGYGYEKYSTGTILRGLAEERGISVLEMNELMKSDKKYDKMIDDATTKVSIEKKDEKVIFDSRLAWHFAVETFKVFLCVSLDEAAARVYADDRGDVENYSSVEEARKELAERADVEEERYREFYGIDYFNFNNYDLVLDSTKADPALLTQILMEEHDKYEAAGKVHSTKVIMSVGRFGFEADKCGTLKKSVYDEKEIVVRRTKHDVEIVSGKEAVMEAAKLGYTLVNVKLADN